MSTLGKELQYSFYLMLHPFKGFWEIKHEKRGSLRTGIIFLVLYMILTVMGGFYNGYQYNHGAGTGVHYPALTNMLVVAMTFFLWCISNWCLTSLFDGEGNFKDICTATGYALLPLILTAIIKLPLSHILSSNEAGFYNMIVAIGTAWAAILILASVIVTQQYTLRKTALIILFAIVGMAVIIYIILLFLNLIQSMGAFIYVLYHEILLRLS